jgi:hypothetical protein
MAKRVGACLVWGQSLPNCDVRVTSAYPLCVQPVSATPLAVYRLTTLGRIYEYTPSSMRARHGVLLEVTDGQSNAELLRRSEWPPRRRERPLCGAATRAGGTCQVRAEPGNARCRFHGGLSTGPKTVAGRARIAEAQRRRWRQYRERRKLVANRLSDPIHPGAADP